MIRKLIKVGYEDYINHTFRNNRNVREFLLKHERRNMAELNLTKEIKAAELLIDLDADFLKTLIKDMAIMFCTAALEHQKQASMSDTEKTRLNTEHFQAEAVIDQWEKELDGGHIESNKPINNMERPLV